MKVRYVWLLPTALLIIHIGSTIASAQSLATPSIAIVTQVRTFQRHSRENRNPPPHLSSRWIPACAGMTVQRPIDHDHRYKTTTLLAQAPSPSDQETALNDSPAPPWARHLNLTAEQRSQLQTIHEQARQAGEELHQQLMAAEEQLRSRLQDEDTSIQTLREYHQQVQQLRQQLDENHFEALLAERQVLTPDQLAQVIQEFRERP